jgi:hypothetical protein
LQISTTQYEISRKKNSNKKFQKFSVNFFFQFLFGYRGSAANLGYACKKFWGPIVWEEIETAQTVVNPKVKFMQKFGCSRPDSLGGDRDCTNSSKPKSQIYI